jgi:hypothetical protein
VASTEREIDVSDWPGLETARTEDPSAAFTCRKENLQTITYAIRKQVRLDAVKNEPVQSGRKRDDDITCGVTRCHARNLAFPTLPFQAWYSNSGAVTSSPSRHNGASIKYREFAAACSLAHIKIMVALT